MANLFIYLTFIYLMPIFKCTLNEIEFNGNNIIGFNNINSDDIITPLDKSNNLDKDLNGFKHFEDKPNNESDKSSAIYLSLGYYFEKGVIGNKGAIYFYSSYDNENTFKEDANRETYFTNKLVDMNDKNKIYDVNCGPFIVDDFYFFCELDESIPKGEYIINFNNITFIYYGVEINLSSPDLEITKENFDMIDIYSGKQTINLSDNKKEYQLKYSVNSYHNEQLYFIITNIIKVKCNQKNKELICPIKRDIIENQLGMDDKIYLSYADRNGIIEINEFISGVNVIHNYAKKDIFVGITNLLTRKNIGKRGVFGFETNITDIPNIDISFIWPLGKELEYYSISCRFLKGGKKPMLIICISPFSYGAQITFLLKETTVEKIINKTVKYNFRIQPMEKEENFTKISYNESIIMKIFPEVLDFTSQNSYQIELINLDSDLLTGITFNEKKEDLECENERMIKRCTVTKDHFKGLKSDYYYVMRDFLNNKEIVYEAIPVKVIRLRGITRASGI